MFTDGFLPMRAVAFSPAITISTFGDSMAPAQMSAASSARRCPSAARIRGLNASPTSGSALMSACVDSGAGNALQAEYRLFLQFDVTQQFGRCGHGLVAADERKMPQRDGARPSRLTVGGERDEFLDHRRPPRASRLLADAVDHPLERFVGRLAHARLVRNQQLAELRNHFRVDLAGTGPGGKSHFGVVARECRTEISRIQVSYSEFPLKVPWAAAGTAQQPVAFVVIQNALVHRVPFELASDGEREVPQDADMRRADSGFDVHDGLLAALDAVLEILAMPRTAEHLDAAARDFVFLGLRLGIGVLPIAVGDREFAFVAVVDRAVLRLDAWWTARPAAPRPASSRDS